MAGRFAGVACFRPNGQLYHFAGASWYNSRKSALIPVFMAGRLVPMGDDAILLMLHGIIAHTPRHSVFACGADTGCFF